MWGFLNHSTSNLDKQIVGGQRAAIKTLHINKELTKSLDKFLPFQQTVQDGCRHRCRSQKPLARRKIKNKNQYKKENRNNKKDALHHRRRRKRKPSRILILPLWWAAADGEEEIPVTCSSGHSGRTTGMGRRQWKCTSLAVDLNRLGKVKQVVPLIVKQCSGSPTCQQAARYVWGLWWTVTARCRNNEWRTQVKQD